MLTEACREGGGGLVWVSAAVEGNGVEAGQKGADKGQEMAAVTHEDQEGEVVAEDPFHDTRDQEQNSTEEDAARNRRGRESTGSAPSHCAGFESVKKQEEAEFLRRAKQVLLEMRRRRRQLTQLAGNGQHSYREAHDGHRRGVTKGLAQITGDFILGGEIELLEELGGNAGVGQDGAELLLGLDPVQLVAAAIVLHVELLRLRHDVLCGG